MPRMPLGPGASDPISARKLEPIGFFCQTMQVAPVADVRETGAFLCPVAHPVQFETCKHMTTELEARPTEEERRMGHDMLATNLRNVAIIAHVDHGKTTLVDGLLKQSNVFRDPDAAGELIMDANDLERERGITILAKNTAIFYEGVKINIIDTPGHADFGGEVERVLNMADGCLLLVDAVEGPMPQTRTVLQRALEIGLRPIVVVNKIDRPAQRSEEVIGLTQDLFLDLASDADQLDFPVVYAIAREGRAGFAPDALTSDLRPLLDTILSSIPAPAVDVEAPAQLLIASLDYDTHRGRVAIGRIHRGTIKAGDTMLQIDPDGEQQRQRITTLETFDGLKRKEIQQASAGDIVAICGFADAKIGATLADPSAPDALAPLRSKNRL